MNSIGVDRPCRRSGCLESLGSSVGRTEKSPTVSEGNLLNQFGMFWSRLQGCFGDVFGDVLGDVFGAVFGMFSGMFWSMRQRIIIGVF